MRLTFLYPNGNYYICSCASQTKAYKKLGQLEDIEEKIGIDLIILLKSLTSGIYHKRNDNSIGYILSCEIALGVGGLSRKEWESDVIWNFKDYGKTWALTKEELL